jgi:hypothetical protein
MRLRSICHQVSLPRSVERHSPSYRCRGSESRQNPKGSRSHQKRFLGSADRAHPWAANRSSGLHGLSRERRHAWFLNIRSRIELSFLRCPPFRHLSEQRSQLCRGGIPDCRAALVRFLNGLILANIEKDFAYACSGDFLLCHVILCRSRQTLAAVICLLVTFLVVELDASNSISVSLPQFR